MPKSTRTKASKAGASSKAKSPPRKAAGKGAKSGAAKGKAKPAKASKAAAAKKAARPARSGQAPKGGSAKAAKAVKRSRKAAKPARQAAKAPAAAGAQASEAADKPDQPGQPGGSGGQQERAQDQFGDYFANLGLGGPNLGDNRFAQAWQSYLGSIAGQPDVLASLAKDQAERQAKLLDSLTKEPEEGGDGSKPRTDPRFAHEAWSDNPFYRFLKESYENNSRMLRESAAAADLSVEDRRALDFLLDQIISATAPSNFPGINPEVIETTIESRGENLRRGMENYLSDAEAGAITQSDPDAFEIGVNVATAPGRVIAQNHVMQLIEYAPSTEQVAANPVLIVPPCINKYYILDLSERNSFVRHLVDAGQRVFLISWVNAGEQQAELGWDDYVAGGVFEALDVVGEVCGNRPINTIGYCIGGTLLSCALAVLRARGELGRVASLSLLTSMLDHVDTGNVGLFVDEEFVSTQESKFASGGVFDGLHLRRTFAYMRPDDLVWPYVVRNYMLGETPQPFDILHWNADSTNLPGRFYSWFLRHNYLDNDLKDGSVLVCDTAIDYRTIKLPGVIIATERDHIVPWQSAYASARLLGERSQFVLASSGHVAGVVNPPGKMKGRHFTSGPGRLPEDPQEWHSQAPMSEGSWWPVLFDFLAERGGAKVAAPKSFGSVRHRPIEQAPGSYVTAPLPKVEA